MSSSLFCWLGAWTDAKPSNANCACPAKAWRTTNLFRFGNSHFENEPSNFQIILLHRFPPELQCTPPPLLRFELLSLRRNMKKLALLLCCLLFAAGSAWAGTGMTTNPAAINQDYYDWCVQFGCLNDYTQYATPQPIVSANFGITGSVGLNGGFQNFYNLQEGVTWNGQFANNQGILYNGRP